MSDPKVHGIHFDFGDPNERRENSFPNLVVDRGLKSGKLDYVPLNEYDLIGLIERASGALRVLKVRRDRGE